MKQCNLEKIKIFICKWGLNKNYSLKGYLKKNGLPLDLSVTKSKQTRDGKPSCTVMRQIIAEIKNGLFGYFKAILNSFWNKAVIQLLQKRVLFDDIRDLLPGK